jgi:hypothetical protein
MAVGGAVALPDWSPDELLSRATTDDDDRLRPPLPSASFERSGQHLLACYGRRSQGDPDRRRHLARRQCVIPCPPRRPCPGPRCAGLS